MPVEFSNVSIELSCEEITASGHYDGQACYLNYREDQGGPVEHSSAVVVISMLTFKDFYKW